MAKAKTNGLGEAGIRALTVVPGSGTGVPGTGLVAALRRGAEKGGLLDLPLDSIVDHPENPRTSLRDLDGLIGSIKAVGVLQPIVVVPVEEFLVAHPSHAAEVAGAAYVSGPGHRRRAAARAAGLTTIPALVRPQGDRIDGYVMLIDENMHRAGLDPIEEARGFALLADAGLTQRAIAERLRISHVTVHRRLSLLTLPQEVQDAVATRRVEYSDAVALAAAPAEDRAQIWSVAQRLGDLGVAVSRAASAREQEAKLAAARGQAEAENVPVVEDREVMLGKDYWTQSLYEADAVEAAREEGTLVAHPTANGLQYYTTVRPPAQAKPSSGGDDHARKLAMQARSAAAGKMVSAPPTPAEACRDMTPILLAGDLDYKKCLTLVHGWLKDVVRLGTSQPDNMYSWRDLVVASREQNRIWVAWAMAIAQAELNARSASRPWDATTRIYLSLLIDTVGYELTPWEQARLQVKGAN